MQHTQTTKTKTKTKMGQTISIVSTKTNKPLTYTQGQCFMNADKNVRSAYSGLDLHLVIGSLGLNGHFEYGGKDWTERDWIVKGRKGQGSWDAHCWLEDKDGNVYDYCFAHYLECAKQWKKGDIAQLYEGVLEAVSKEECAKRSMEFVAAPPKIQILIKREFVKLGMMTA